jgi:transposase-like protein
MTEPSVPFTTLSDAQRAQAHTRFTIIRPALEGGVNQAQVACTRNIPASTVQRWVKRYSEKGLAGWQIGKEESHIRSFLATKGGLGAFESDTIEKGEIRRSGLSFLKNRFSLV